MHHDHRKELANTITHGLGLLVFLIAIPFLLFKGYQLNNKWLLFGAAMFSLGLLKVYSFSTLYHASTDPILKHRFRIMDHISIFWLIAGSYTPFVIKYVPHQTAILFLVSMWTIVLLGTFAKLFFTGKYDILSTVAYVALGWMVVFIFEHIMAIPPAILTLIVVGGLSYTFGVIFYTWKRYRYHHAVWHLCVLCGSGCHFMGVFLMME